MKFFLNERNRHAMANCFTVAADRFKDNARTMEQVAATGGNPMLTADAAKMLAAEFASQAQQARAFSQIFDALLDPVELVYDQDPEDDENPFHPESPEGRDWQRQFDKLTK